MNRLRGIRVWTAVWFVVLVDGCSDGSPAGSTSADSNTVSYQGDVRPILASTCYHCHGADPSTRQGDLRLDQRDRVFGKSRDGRPLVVPFEPDASLLFQRVLSRQMPPPGAKPTLTGEQIEVLRRWIAQGAEFEDHWAYLPPVRPVPPPIRDRWVQNPIDAFVLQGLHEAGLEPAPEAERPVLLRRLSFDLTGLPPTPEEIAAFTDDDSPDAYDKVVLAKLGDAAYGEHRAHYWLDNARYADTHGYHLDNYRSIWPYRDYVIRAFNDNQPFDRFTVEQLAGDLLDDPTPAQLIATGFIRNSMSTAENGIIEEEYAAIYAKERVDTLASVYLGLTVGCADCHDHKFDPIKQSEFYALSAFFRNTTQPVSDDNSAEAPPTAVDPESGVASLVTGERDEEPSAFVLERALYDQKGERVTADVPAVLSAFPDGEPRNRLGLARWLMGERHPLAARVNVNRLWAQLFGEGLVRTADDFGAMGELPEHPELLDWLAVEFRDSGWDVKQLLHLIVSSATYRQSAVASPEARAKDPDNRLYSRGSRFRLDAEMIRDQALAASGLLVRKLGGPSVKPYQPAGLWEAVAMEESNTREYEQGHGDDLYRRSVYTFWKRSAPPPAMELFNAPSREHSVAQRERTNTPLQALVLLNDPQFVEAARQLGAIALAASKTRSEQLDAMGMRVLGRPFSEPESALLQASWQRQLDHYLEHEDDARALLAVGESPSDSELAPAEQAAAAMMASVVLNLDEALNR